MTMQLQSTHNGLAPILMPVGALLDSSYILRVWCVASHQQDMLNKPQSRHRNVQKIPLAASDTITVNTDAAFVACAFAGPFGLLRLPLLQGCGLVELQLVFADVCDTDMAALSALSGLTRLDLHCSR